MSDPTPHMLGIVIRKDGTVPIDEDVPEGHREHIKRWLTAQGHAHDEVAGTRHFKIHHWPRA